MFSIVVRKRLGKKNPRCYQAAAQQTQYVIKYRRNNRLIIGRVVFNAYCVVSSKVGSSNIFLLGCYSAVVWLLSCVSLAQKYVCVKWLGLLFYSSEGRPIENCSRLFVSYPLFCVLKCYRPNSWGWERFSLFTAFRLRIDRETESCGHLERLGQRISTWSIPYLRRTADQGCSV
jgi:hypothetical protein